MSAAAFTVRDTAEDAADRAAIADRRGEPTVPWEALRASLDIADVPLAAFHQDSGIAAEDELAYLSGDGPDPTMKDDNTKEVER